MSGRCKVKKLLIAPPNIFTPIPKVQGTVLDFKPSAKYKDIDYTKLKILSLAFSQRRKKIKTNLKIIDIY